MNPLSNVKRLVKENLGDNPVASLGEFDSEMFAAAMPGLGSLAGSVAANLQNPKQEVAPSFRGDGFRDLDAIRNQEFRRTNTFDVGAIASMAGAGSAIAPGIGTLVGAGVGLVSEGIGEISQQIAKRKFNKEKEATLNNATEFNASKHYADRMRGLQSLQSRMQAQRMMGLSDGI